MFKKTALAALAALALGLSGLAAHAEDKVSVRLSWFVHGIYTPLYLGVERGFYKDEGIDLTIYEGRGSVVSTQAVGTGADTFALADGGTIVVAAAKGLPIKSVFTVLNVSPYAVIAPVSAGIKTAKDLEGRTVAFTAGDSFSQLFPAVAKANNVDESKINKLFIDPAGKVVAVAEGRADALLGGKGAQDLQLNQRGVETSLLMFSDLGVKTIGIGIVANTDTIKNDPDLVRRFVSATAKSYEAAMADPEASAAAAVAAKPDADKDLLVQQLEQYLDLIKSPEMPDKVAGYGDPARWQQTRDLMFQYGGAPDNGQPADAFYTNEYVDVAVK